MSRTTARLPYLTAALMAGALVLSGCGQDDSNSSGHGGGHASASATDTGAAEATHSDADVQFAAGMLEHHGQAVAMSELARDRAAAPRVKDLAARIEAAQGPEIDTLNGWLAEWGAEADTDAMDGMDHGSMGHGDMGGMMSEEDMAALAALSGPEFDRQFLVMMVAHHRGAVSASEAQLADGRNSDALAMAETIRDTQNGEIAEMEQLLTELGG
ncbi:DUF305 domain-containing protein [Geodermatophilus sp. SYSU D00079]